MSETERVEAPKSGSKGVPDPVGAPDKPSGTRRMINILAAVLAGVVLPVLVVGALVGHFGGSALFLGLLLGALGSKLGGTRRMLYLAPAMGVAAGPGAGTAYGWWWVHRRYLFPAGSVAARPHRGMLRV